MYDLGMKLRELRKSKKLTQKRLPELLDISEASISKYEGNLAAPSIEILRAYAALFNISMDELLGNQRDNSVSLHGLTDEQSEIVASLVELFRNINTSIVSQKFDSIIGKIVIELCKSTYTEKQDRHSL